MKIKEIELNGFRAYQYEKFTIPDNKNIILIYARNGFGKTSFFDGIEWGLTGKLRRYEETAGRERKEYPVLSNSFSETNNNGVKITFTTNESVERLIISNQEDDYNDGKFTVENKNIHSINDLLVDKKFKNDVNFLKSFTFTQLLSQELISDFVRNTKDNDRYKTVVELFGLSAYKEFDEHIRQTQLYLKNEVEKIVIEQNAIKNNIVLEKSKLISFDIQPLIKLDELKKIYGKKVDLKNIKAIQGEFNELKERLSKEKTDYDNTINQLTYLKNNFQEREKKIVEYINLKKEIEEYKKFIEKISIKVYFENIDKNIESAKLYNEKKDKIEKINKEIDELKIVANSHEFFVKSKYGDDLISLLADYQKEYEDMVFRYFESKKIQIEQNKILNQLEIDLKRISGLKNELYYIAKSFLEDTQNKGLKECPVCENKFDRSETINDSIQKIKVFLMKNHKHIKNESKKLLNICTKIKAEYRKTFINLLSEQKQNNGLLKSYNDVIESMENLAIESKNYKQYRKQYFKEIKESKFYVEDMSENFYKEDILRKENQRKSIYREIEDYKRLKMLYQINQFKDINNIINSKNTQIKKLLYKIENTNRAIILSSELVHFEQNNKQQKNIKQLNEKLKFLEKEVKALNQINGDYKNLKEAIKKTIDNETKKLLTDYGKVIKKFYHYLNPSIYMNKLSITDVTIIQKY